MAIEFVGGITANYAGATSGSNTVSLTSLTGGISSSAAEGDLVLVAVSTAVSNVGTPGTDLINDGSSSYTYLRQYTRQNFFTSPFEGSRLELGYKFMGATPDASVTIEPSGNAAFAQAVAIMVFRGVDPDTPQDVSLTTAEDDGAADKTNPPAITPSTAGAWIVAVGSAGSSNSYSDFTSADLDNMTSDFGSDNYDCVVGMAYKDDWTSGSFNPVEWNGGSSDANGAWQAVTLALRPDPILTLEPPLLSNAQTFFAPTVSTSYTLTAPLLSIGQTFHAPTITTSYDLAAPLLTNTQTIFTPVVGQYSLLEPSLLSNTQTFFAATITTSYGVEAPLLASGTTIFAPALTASYSLTAPLLTNTQSFFAPTVQRVVTAVTPTERIATFSASKLTDRTASFSLSRLSARTATVTE